MSTGADRERLLARARVGPRELGAEALAGVGQRPLRSVLTALGAAVGVCAVVAVLGLTTTASAQVNERFDALRAREVTVRLADEAAAGAALLGDDAEEQVGRLPGVVAAGRVARLGLDDVAVTSLPLPGEASSLSVRVVSARAWDVLHARLAAGRLYDAGHEQRADRVAVLGRGAAERLGVQRLDALPAVFVDGVPFTVVGVVDDVARVPDLLGAVMMPPAAASAVWDRGDATVVAGTELVVETDVGAATAIAGHVPLLLDPVHPERVRVESPPDPRSLSRGVGSDLDVLSLALAAVSVVLGALGISNTMLVTVMERVHEIGLRRALGAGGGHVAAQFLLEAAVLGGLGGLVGSGVGVLAVVLTAALREWTPVVAPWVLVVAPALGLVAGLAAGVLPALRAARVQPADALRR